MRASWVRRVGGLGLGLQGSAGARGPSSGAVANTSPGRIITSPGQPESSASNLPGSCSIQLPPPSVNAGRAVGPEIMRSLPFVLACLSAVLSPAALVHAKDNSSDPLSSKQILQGAFKPPQVFKNVNLVRNVNLEKAYPRETINVVIENVDQKPQDEYYLPFEAALISQIGGLEVRDKKDAEKPSFDVEVVEFDAHR